MYARTVLGRPAAFRSRRLNLGHLATYPLGAHVPDLRHNTLQGYSGNANGDRYPLVDQMKRVRWISRCAWPGALIYFSRLAKPRARVKMPQARQVQQVQTRLKHLNPRSYSWTEGFSASPGAMTLGLRGPHDGRRCRHHAIDFLLRLRLRFDG